MVDVRFWMVTASRHNGWIHAVAFHAGDIGVVTVTSSNLYATYDSLLDFAFRIELYC